MARQHPTILYSSYNTKDRMYVQTYASINEYGWSLMRLIYWCTSKFTCTAKNRVAYNWTEGLHSIKELLLQRENRWTTRQTDSFLELFFQFIFKLWAFLSYSPWRVGIFLYTIIEGIQYINPPLCHSIPTVMPVTNFWVLSYAVWRCLNLLPCITIPRK